MNLKLGVLGVLALGFVANITWAQANRVVFHSLADLDKCANANRYDTGVCYESLQEYAKKHPKENFAIAKRARLHFKHWAALEFFEPGLGKAPSAEQCGDEDLRLAVLSGLALPDDYVAYKIAGRIFPGACFSALRPAVEKAVKEEGGSGYLWQNACAALALKAVKLDACSPQPVAVAPAPPVPEKLPQVNLKTAKIGVIRVYRGAEGERLTMANLPEMPDAFVIRFDGVRSAWNEKTIVHRESSAGSNRIDYWTERNGERWVSVRASMSGGQRQYEFFLPDVKGALAVSYSESDTQRVTADMLR